MSRNILKICVRIAIPLAFWLGVWQLAAMAVDLELLLPSPVQVWTSLTALAGTDTFWLSALFTLARVFAGLLGGTVLGGLLAFATHFSPSASLLLAPAIRVVRATPVVSFILLVYLWVSRANIPGVIAAMMVLPVVWGGLTAGLDGVDPQLLELARAYRFSRWKTLRLIYLPSLRPYFLSAVTTAMGLAWKSGVAAEVLCLPNPALGTRIYNTKYYLEVPELFAWTAVVVALSLILERLLRLALGRWGGGAGRA